MTTNVTLAPDVAEKLERRTAVEGRSVETLVNEILRHELECNSDSNVFASENALEGLQEFIGKFDSTKVNPSNIVRSSDPYEEAFGDALIEKYRKQGLQF